MGNYLVGIAPSEIYPVEHYLRDHNDIKFEKSLGSTRFFKVARARNQEGLIVVKVFVIHDPALLLQPYKDKIDEIRSKLASAVNCLPFQKGIVGEKACFLMRQYVHHSLYDRISTKPFLTNLEKKWITFQALCAVHQAHKYGVCHGDIKTENIMITSWNWILLTDFASFKPTVVAKDTPADFSYFFDMSRRRACYVAPERFVRTITYEVDNTSNALFSDQDLKIGDLHPMMDIFSLGCALIELYNEGRPPFDFPGLLGYRNIGENFPTKFLNNIDDEGIRDMLTSMIQRDPANRKSAEIYLEQARGTVFPEYFYSFLQPYMQIFSAPPILTPDEKINRLKTDIANIMDVYKQGYKEQNNEKKETGKEEMEESKSGPTKEDSGQSEECTVCETESDVNLEKEKKTDESKDVNQEEQIQDDSKKPEIQVTKTKQDLEGEEFLAMITQLVTSCIRGLQHPDSKIETLGILIQLAEKTSEETVLDRILPYILHLINDPSSRVRVQAIHTLTKCLTLVKNVPPTDINIFPEYILPGLAHLPQDTSVIVRAAYAENIADIAKISLRYLDNSFSTLTENKELQDNEASYDTPQRNYDSELQTLHDMVQAAVSMLLADQDNLVKRTLMESGLDKLCRFFGKQKANDVLLSHLITFLNDKGDKELRSSFFECIVDVAEYVGWHCSPILMPLLQQGLTDTEEFVIPYAINAMATLTKRSLLHKSALYQLLAETVIFLVHPNLWIRHATVGFVSAAASSLSPVDVQIKVHPMIEPYLKQKLFQVDKEFLVFEALVQPIPRAVFDAVVKYNDIEDLFQVFEQRRIARAKATTGIMPQYNDMCTSLRNLFRRLNSEHMTETVEDQLLAMKSHILKISNYQKSDAKKNVVSHDGRIDISHMKHKIIYKCVTLSSDFKSNVPMPTTLKKVDRRMADGASYATMNQEWRNMFAAQESGQTSVKMSEISSGSPSHSVTVGDMRMSPQHSLTDTMNSNNDHSLHERSYIQCNVIKRIFIVFLDKDTPCQIAIKQLESRKQAQYAAAVKAQHFVDNMEWQQKSNLLPTGWRPKGVHVAFLHEHKGSINQIVDVPNSNLIASSSSDGSVKIWDISKMEGKNICNRSKQSYHTKDSTYIGLVSCEQGQSLATTCPTAGTVFVLRIEPGSNKLSLQQARQLDSNEEGYAVDIQYLDSGSQSMLVYATLYGHLVGWDLRCPGVAWRLENDLKYGVITSFCINNYQQWLALGTSSGVHIGWDLRFQLAITNIKHPSNARVRKVITHPTEHSWVISAVQGNNEISMWDLETKSRRQVLWASSAPPLSRSQGGHSVCAMHTAYCNQSGFLLASGTDMRVRYWNLSKPTESFVMLPAANDTIVPTSLCYEDRLVDGTHVVQEVLASGDVESSATSGSKQMMSHSKLTMEEGCGQGPEPPRTGHHDSISAITMSNTNIVTGSCDGLIQIWK
ncbi:phosphoinositide 3-kinase regulatory subunit 4 isoform X2 [Copidosoma floridanum]|uniref:phosphoinositide 3-kinase regulatory subunit 4 isoform X2 n=1 Tax=Copidosoma floridanum TaxID=29053 RepID=UPI000C6FC88A|nr:phosphoinositide 3-kinase regulatory subunit 4 isoform X2 [Copidosoma floridanum]